MPRIKKTIQDSTTPKTDEKWFKKTIEENGASVAKLSTILLGNQNLLGRVFRGERRLQIDEAIKLGSLLHVPFSIIVQKLGYTFDGATAAIVGTVNALGRVVMAVKDPPEYVTAPTDFDTRLVAIRIEAPHSPLQEYDGALLFYSPARAVDPAAFQRLAIMEAQEQPTPFIGYMGRGKGSKAASGPASALTA